MKKKSEKFSLFSLLIVVFVSLNFFSVGLTAFFSFHSGKTAVREIVTCLCEEVTFRIQERLHFNLKTPIQIGRMNQNMIRRGLLPVGDMRELEQFFLQQVRLHEWVSSIYFGNPKGGLADAGREGTGGFLYVIETDGFASGPFRKYSVDRYGRKEKLLVTVPDFDARTRTWYKNALKKKEPVWSDPYILFTGQDMAVAASRPVYSDLGDFLGVISVDLFLSHFTDFLHRLSIGKTGKAFIIDRSANLVASSADTSPFASDKRKKRHRISVFDSASPVIQKSVEEIKKIQANFEEIQSPIETFFEFTNERYLLRVSPLADPTGPDWIVGVVIPESDFMERIDENRIMTIFIMVSAIIATTILGMLITLKILNPVRKLAISVKNFPGQIRNEAIVPESPIREIHELGKAFDSMSRQLNKIISDLNAEVESHKQAELALKQSEEKFSKAFYSSPLLISITQMDSGRFIDVNPAFTRILGYRREEIVGKKSTELNLWEDPKNREEMLGEVKNTGRADGLKVNVLSKIGKIHTMLFSAQPTAIGTDNCLISVAADITELVQVRKEMEKLLEKERTQRALAEIMRNTAETMNRADDLEPLLDNLLRNIGKVIPHDASDVMLLEKESIRIVHALDHRSEEKKDSNFKLWNRKNVYSRETFPDIKRLIETRSSFIIRDTRTSREWNIYPESAWVRSTLHTPILVKEKVIGSINLYHGTCDAFDKKDADRLEAFSNQVSVAVERIRLQEQLRIHTENLEQLVSERTRALEDRNEELRRFALLAADREIRMKELREEIRKLTS